MLCVVVPEVEDGDFSHLKGSALNVHSSVIEERLAPGRLDGFSIGRYEKNRKSFDLYAVKFEIGAMRFLGEKSLRRWNPFKTRIPPLSLGPL